MKPALSDQADRDQIATALDDTLIVEAAAGAGKTTELVRRIVRVIETGRAEVTEIVAVTFTEKAAGELKLRLREALEEARQASVNSSDERDRLDRALGRLEEAQVSTIHGFCADLLRERPVEARIDPLFVVLTEAQAARIYDESFDRWLEIELANPSDGVKRALRRPSFGGFGAEADSANGPTDRLRRAGWELLQWRDFDGEWQRPGFARASHIDELVQLLNEFAALLESPQSSSDPLYADSWAARKLAEEIRRTETVASRDCDRIEAGLIELNHNRDFRDARKGGGKNYRNGTPREHVWRMRDTLQHGLVAFEAAANADLAAALHVELRGCISAYEAAKAKKGALDFLDLLQKTRDVIRDNPSVRSSFQSRFKRIFVDEFQDTDPLQTEILLLLASADSSVSDWRKTRPAPGKLFFVGDPKQSIYRFRRADVGIYRTVYEMLEAAGARRITLRTSFRARPNMQRAINAAFAPVMRGDSDSLQAAYVALQPFRPDPAEQPSFVVLPVPEPYGYRRISNAAIEKSLPDAVGAFVDWLVHESGWKVAERPAATKAALTPSAALGFRPAEAEHLVPVQARHICLLFRRFVSFQEDMTRPYVEALEARGIPHLLVGGRSFHNRAEIEALRAALAAIEWPEDELSVFATLRGSLFAISDEELLEYRQRFRRLHPFRIPDEFPEHLAPLVRALKQLQTLHRSRNRTPVATTLAELLRFTRAHVGFALEHGGEQVLANIAYVSDLARRYEAEGGISFRGFIDELSQQAENGEISEAPILEEGSDGVRLMTVHRAKGLEFPVVILADMTAKLRASVASRTIDSDRGVCAIRLAGCLPADLVQHEDEELCRDEAEGVRVAYVAATRARDLLVIPAVGDEARDGWIQPLNTAIYPPMEVRQQQVQAPGCAQFKSKDSVLVRPGGTAIATSTVCPGLHVLSPKSAHFPIPRGDRVAMRESQECHSEPEAKNPRSVLRRSEESQFLHYVQDKPSAAPQDDITTQSHGTGEERGGGGEFSVVWWDPRVLRLGAEAPLGIRRPELIVKDVAPNIIETGLGAYNSWRDRRDQALDTGGRASIEIRTVTQAAKHVDAAAQNPNLPSVEIIKLPRAMKRPFGPRFGALVHAVLATVPLDGDSTAIEKLADVHGRIVGATNEETAAAAQVVSAALAHPLMHQARSSARENRSRREVPIVWRDRDGCLTEGVVDLAFEQNQRWVVIDFKTDEDFGENEAAYRRQVGLYAVAIEAATNMPATPILMRV